MRVSPLSTYSNAFAYLRYKFPQIVDSIADVPVIELSYGEWDDGDFTGYEPATPAPVAPTSVTDQSWEETQPKSRWYGFSIKKSIYTVIVPVQIDDSQTEVKVTLDRWFKKGRRRVPSYIYSIFWHDQFIGRMAKAASSDWGTYDEGELASAIPDGYGQSGQGFDLSDYNNHGKKDEYSAGKYPILVDKKTFNVPRYGEVEVEFRQKQEEELKYVRTGPPDETGYRDMIRDEQGLATYYSQQEMIDKDLPLTDTTIYIFSGGLGIGHVGDSFGATETFVVREFQGGGIGSYLLKLYMKANPSKSHNTPMLGQMTWQGIATAKKAWMLFVEEAVKEGKKVSSDVIASYQKEKQDRVDNPPQRTEYDIPQHKTKKVQFSPSGPIIPMEGFNIDILTQMGIKFWDIETDHTGRPQRWASDDGSDWDDAMAFVESLGYQAEGYRTYTLKMDYSGKQGVILPANA